MPMLLRRRQLLLLFGALGVATLAIGGPPAQARRAPGFTLESTSGASRTPRSYAGKVVLLMYEDRDSGAVNAPLKAEVEARIRQEKLDGRLVVVPVADLRSYDYWGFRAIVRRAVVAKAKELEVEILLDWSGDIFRAYGFRTPGSNVVLIGRDGSLVYQRSGPLGPSERRRFHDQLSAALVEGVAALVPGSPS